MLKSLLARNGIPTSLSPADQAYRAGLSDYFAGRYHDAVAEFDKVLAVQPNQALARQYRAEAIASYPNEPAGGTSPWLWLGIGAGIMLIGAGVTALLISRRRRTRPAPAGAMTQPVAPLPPPVTTAGPPDTGVMTPAEDAAAVSAEAPPVPAAAGEPVAAEPKEAREAAGTFCPNCGAPHLAEAHFCESCGQPLTGAA